MNAIRLRTSYLNEPLGMDIVRPHFFWNCEGGIKQTAYQIIARAGDETVWNSGKVESSSMTHITYSGRPLKSRERVYWQVMLWDENGEVGEISESWFEMGLLDKTDWRSAWISGNYQPQSNARYPVDCFKKEFQLAKTVAYARLYASARGVYDVTINGHRIEDFILAPGMTDYRKRIQYQTYDVTDLLDTYNCIELRLADGWFRGSTAAYGVTNVYGSQTSILSQLEITFSDGTRQTVCTDESWSWSNDGPIRFADLKDGEFYNAAMKPSYRGNAVTVDGDVNLVASNNVFVREQERFHAKLLPGNVLDFGQNIAGYLEFTVHGNAGSVLCMTCGETLDSDGNLDMSGIQETKPIEDWSRTSLVNKLITGKVDGKSVCTPLQEIRFVCSGGKDHYKTSFAVFGFRYVQIKTDTEIDPNDFTAIAVYSDMEQTGSFSCSNPMVNQLYQNTLWSMKSNFLDLPTDCPTRERLGWTGDAQIFFDTGAYLMDTASFFRKWLTDMQDAQYEDGLMPAVLPYQGVEMMYKHTGASVGWADAVYLIPYRYHRLLGDKHMLENAWPMMKKYADHLLSNLGMTDEEEARKNPHNAYVYEKGFHLGEWLEPVQFQEKITPGKQPKRTEEATAYLYLTMKTMSQIAEILEHYSEQTLYLEIAEGSRKAYDHLFVKTGTMDTDRQAKLVRPLALGLLEGEAKTYAQKRLIQAVKSFNYCVGTGFLSTAFLLPMLTEAGAADIAYKMLENTNMPSWLGEVNAGATTIWETWEGEVSLNHYSPGAVCQWLFDTVCGIRPDGENHFIISPIPGGTLTYANASYKSLYGKVESKWVNTTDGFRYCIYVPVNCSATVILPDGSSHVVTAGKHEF